MGKAFVSISAAIVAVAASTASAAPIIFTGAGMISRSTGTLPATGTAGVGDPISFSFVFDPDTATPLSTSDTFAAYALPFTSFSAMVGDYAFMPSGSTAQLTIGRGFTFFGGSSTEPSRSYGFTFQGVPGAGAPFTGAALERFTVSASFRDQDPTRPVSLADVVDPTAAALRTVSYLGAASGQRPPFGSVSGSYQGGFASISAVPEPGTWAMMILGFGVVGATMRKGGRRTTATLAV